MDFALGGNKKVNNADVKHDGKRETYYCENNNPTWESHPVLYIVLTC